MWLLPYYINFTNNEEPFYRLVDAITKLEKQISNRNTVDRLYSRNHHAISHLYALIGHSQSDAFISFLIRRLNKAHWNNSPKRVISNNQLQIGAANALRNSPSDQATYALYYFENSSNSQHDRSLSYEFPRKQPTLKYSKNINLFNYLEKLRKSNSERQCKLDYWEHQRGTISLYSPDFDEYLNAHLRNNYATNVNLTMLNWTH